MSDDEDSITPVPILDYSIDQSQREAIFDFLLLATYADNSLRPKEEQRLHELISGLGWKSYKEPSAYADEATARIRAAAESEVSMKAFLAEISERLVTPAVKVFALAIMPRVLESDNSMLEAEQAFYDAAKEAFGV